MIRARTAALLAVSVSLLWAPAARAQSAEPPRFELGFGALWMGADTLGAKSATETTSTASTSTLFATSSDLAGAAGIDGRVGVRLSRQFAVEAEASYLKPQLQIATSGDAEGAAAITAAETIQQFTIGGNLLWRVPGRRWSPRFAPFATVGGGYLRQLHDQATLVATGRFYQFGGGVSALLVSSRHLYMKGIGVRADVRAVVRSKGVAFDGGSNVAPAAGVSLFARF